jgi:5-methylcytosine-specific restriction endonuclease McrA
MNSVLLSLNKKCRYQSEKQPTDFLKSYWFNKWYEHYCDIIKRNKLSKDGFLNWQKNGTSKEKISILLGCSRKDVNFLMSLFSVKVNSFNTKSKHITKKELYNLYIIKKVPTTEISSLYHISFCTIVSLLKKYNIPIRNTKEWWLVFDEPKKYKISKKIFEHGVYSNGKKYEDHVKDRDEYKHYRRKTEKKSLKNAIIFNLNDINKRGHQSTFNSMCIDHIIPIKFGYINNISPDKMSNISNLVMTSHTKNSKKNSRITKSSIKLYKNWVWSGFLNKIETTNKPILGKIL